MSDMAGLSVRSAEVPLPRGDVRLLRDIVDGPVLTAGDDGYDDARRLFNATVDHRPQAIVQVTSAADVAAAIRFARERGIDVSVKGGAHGVVGHATAGRLVIDLSRMGRVSVDPAARRAVVGGGAVWGDVDSASQAHGLATPAGRVTHTGVAGLTLGGGQGWLSSKHGLTVDNLTAAELVTADGRVVSVDADSEPELFWALRGGGGNFGVVTSFTFALHEVGPMVLGGMLVYPGFRLPEILAAYDQLVSSAPDDLGSAIGIRLAPPAPFVPPEAVGKPVVAVILGWFGNDLAEGERAIAPLRALGPVVDLVSPMPYLALQQMTDEGNEYGHRNYWSGGYVNHVTEAFVGDITDVALDLPSMGSMLLIAPMGAAANRVPQEATAFGHREARYLYHPMALWDDVADDERCIQWTKRAMAAAAPHTDAGTYLNVDGEQTKADRVRFSFGDDAFRRLVAVKRQWDPDNVFRYNANIDPRADR